MRNNHVKTMKNYIEKLLQYSDYCKITHKDILRETNANCCYSVLKGLKNYYDITEKWIEKENCRYKEYTLRRKEDAYAKKTNLWGIRDAIQLSFI